MAQTIDLKTWWDNVSVEARPTVLALLGVIVNQSESWMRQWADYLSKGNSAMAYQMAYEAMTEAEFLAQGQMISTASNAANTDNATKLEAQREVVYALMSFGIKALVDMIPFLLAAL